MTPAQKAYTDYFGMPDPDHFQDAYQGEHDTLDDAKQALLELWYDCSDVPAHIMSYIDEDKLLRDLLVEYFIWPHGGSFYVFSRY